MTYFGRRPSLAFTLVIIALAAILLYWPTLTLPLLFDDLLHIRLAEEVNLITLWLPSTRFGFYRPLVFLPFLLIKPLFGYYPGPLLHGLSLGQHALNAVLLATLLWRLWHQWRPALAAGFLLAFYPFAYQAIAFFGNNAYPTSAGLILLGLHTYLAAIHSSSGEAAKWWLATALLFLLGLFTHETAVLFGPLAALLHLTWRLGIGERRLPISNPQSPISNLRAPFLIFILLGGVYIVLYQFLPVGGGPLAQTGTTALWPKVLYLLQTAVYPFAWLNRLLPHLPAGTLILSSLLLTLGLTAWAARRRQSWPPLLLGWGWWLLASLLIGINLPTYYILHGARLVYLGGVGIALVWAVLLDGLFDLPKAGPAIWAAALLFILATSGAFVRGRLVAFTDIADPIAVVEEVMASQPAGEGVLLVNLPAWTAPSRNTYPVGVEYVTLMGSHLFAEELVNENLAEKRPVLAIGVPELLSDPGYPYGIHNQAIVETVDSDWAAAGSHIFISRYTNTGITTRYAGHFVRVTGLVSPLATFGPYELTAATAIFCEGAVEVTLSWMLPQPDIVLSPTTSHFVQVLDDNGRLIAQSDGPPLDLRPDFVRLQPEWMIIDRRHLLLSEPGEPAQLLVGVYDFASGQRFTARDSRQEALPDNAFRTTVAACD